MVFEGAYGSFCRVASVDVWWQLVFQESFDSVRAFIVHDVDISGTTMLPECVKCFMECSCDFSR
jgi:hypothetical protein